LKKKISIGATTATIVAAQSVYWIAISHELGELFQCYHCCSSFFHISKCKLNSLSTMPKERKFLGGGWENPSLALVVFPFNACLLLMT
jgi:hypothetical protein